MANVKKNLGLGFQTIQDNSFAFLLEKCINIHHHWMILFGLLGFPLFVQPPEFCSAPAIAEAHSAHAAAVVSAATLGSCGRGMQPGKLTGITLGQLVSLHVFTVFTHVCPTHFC